MQAILDRVQDLNTQIAGLQARKWAITTQLEADQKEMGVLEARKAHLVKTTAVLDSLTQKVAEKGIGRVETVITQGLGLVFGPKVSCVLEKRDGAKGTTYRIRIKAQLPQGDIIGDPMGSFGGGPVNVTSFLLRVLMLHRFKLARLMVLDESFNNVSAQHLPAVSELLQALAKDFGFTILTITHQPLLASSADRIYDVSGALGSPVLTERHREDVI